MEDIQIISTEKAPGAIGPYSQAIRSGNHIFTSGQIPIDIATGEFVSEDISEQAEQVLKNLSEVLAAGGAGLDTVIKTTVFLADMNDFAAMNEVYSKWFVKNKPARSTVEAAGLPRGARIEIECIAIVK